MNVKRPTIKVRVFGKCKTQLLDLAIHAHLSESTVLVGDKQRNKTQELVGSEIKVNTYTSVDSTTLDGLLLLAEPDNSVDMFQFKQMLKHIDRFIVDRQVIQ